MDIERLLNNIQQWLSSFGVNDYFSHFFGILIIIISIVIISLISNYITKNIILRVLRAVTRRTKTNWDDIIYQRKVFNKLSHLVPAILIYFLIPFALYEYKLWMKIVQEATNIYMVIVVLMVLNSFINALHDIYNEYDISKSKPIKGYVQVVKIIIYFIGAIIIISTLVGRSPGILLGGLGAFAAVLMLIFKDAILGLVAGVQLSANDMVLPGDWISMPKYGADGDVLEISLTTVKVQNFDKTIVTIPTYALISDSFQNWRGMDESGGRRIKRSINLNMNSVKFCNEEMLTKFGKIKILADYLERTQKILDEHNSKYGLDDSILVNGRRQTNIGVFRAYVEAYLRNNDNIRKDMTFLVRQLQPDEKGIPIEIYVFSKVQAWAEYEVIQADIFDHLMAVIPEFELQVFQNPTGSDFRSLSR
ncbi:MAG: mechanosensitive ion channel family protein [Saprospiraceae bacterium]|nr:mechanosensitive ion channel family protein [Saprospiraceae bacterium]